MNTADATRTIDADEDWIKMAESCKDWPTFCWVVLKAYRYYDKFTFYGIVLGILVMFLFSYILGLFGWHMFVKRPSGTCETLDHLDERINKLDQSFKDLQGQFNEIKRVGTVQGHSFGLPAKILSSLLKVGRYMGLRYEEAVIQKEATDVTKRKTLTGLHLNSEADLTINDLGSVGDIKTAERHVHFNPIVKFKTYEPPERGPTRGHSIRRVYPGLGSGRTRRSGSLGRRRNCRERVELCLLRSQCTSCEV